MKSGMAVLRPYMVPAKYEPIGKVVIGSVKGDVHDIGKNLVGMVLEGVGFEINDLGTDVPPAKFVAAVQASGVNILALSALLTTTMPSMKLTIEALKTAGLRKKVKVIICGAPITESFARHIGADGYAPDAASAVPMARALVGR
jgi:5-methyltetrahydrofolate--homocysteine methyltransferase